MDVEASFDLSYQLLPPDLQRLWSLISVFPADFDLAGAAAVWEMEETPAEDALGELIRWSLVDFLPSATAEGGRYRLHDHARDFAGSRLDEAFREQAGLRHAEHCRDVLSIANKFYKQGKEGTLEGLALFDQERANILAGQSWAAKNLEGNSSIAIDLCKSYPVAGSYVLDLRLSPRERIPWLETALEACRRSNDKAAEGAHLGNLGNAYSHLGDPRKAIEYNEKALAISREIGDRRGEGNSLGNLGNAYSDLGDLRKAIEYNEKALAISREIGDRRGEEADLGNLGNAYLHLGDPRKAIDYLDQSLAISREISDRWGEGNGLFHMSRSLRALGQNEKAVSLARSALAIFEEIESPNAETFRKKLAEWGG